MNIPAANSGVEVRVFVAFAASGGNSSIPYGRG